MMFRKSFLGTAESVSAINRSILFIVSTVLFSLTAMTAMTATAGPWLGDVRSLADDDVQQWDSAIAYNPIHDQYLVVWTAATDWSSVTRIFGIRVDGDGLPIGSSFEISGPGNDQFEPDVSFDPVNYNYLVAWTFDFSGDGSDTDILARLIPWDGPSPSLPVFTIEEALTRQRQPAVAYNPDSPDFLIVWENTLDLSSFWITGRLVPADGIGISGILTITGGFADFFAPDVAWNRETGEYLIVYERFESGGSSDVYGTRLTSTGDIIPPEIGIAGWPGNEGSPAVASCRDNYLVAWIAYSSARSDPDSEVYVRAVSGDGTVGSIVTDLPGNFIHERAPFVACTEGSREYLVAWQPIFADSGNYGVVGAFLDPDAAPQEGTFAIAAPTFGTTIDFASPSLAFGADAGALIVWEADRPPNDTLLDMKGRLVGNRLFADGFDAGNLSYWSENQKGTLSNSR